MIAVVLAAVFWTGTASVHVMMWEQGGEHPYKTDFELRYREGKPVAVNGAGGRILAHRIPLTPDRVRLKVWHEVRGLLNCVGTGEETLEEGADAALIVPARGVTDVDGLAVPSEGAYQLVLPRAIGAFACGTNVRNRKYRAVGIGAGLFRPDLEVEDSQVRGFTQGGQVMRGSYVFRRDRNYSGRSGDTARYEFHVKWELRRATEE